MLEEGELGQAHDVFWVLILVQSVSLTICHHYRYLRCSRTLMLSQTTVMLSLWPAPSRTCHCVARIPGCRLYHICQLVVGRSGLCVTYFLTLTQGGLCGHTVSPCPFARRQWQGCSGKLLSGQMGLHMATAAFVAPRHLESFCLCFSLTAIVLVAVAYFLLSQSLLLPSLLGHLCLLPG